MARIRSIKPSIWGDDKFAALSRDARLLALGLISAADDAGRFIASPTAIAGAVYPHDELGPATVRRWRDEIARTGLIEIYQVGGREYGWFPKWRNHQVINRPSKSTLPAPPNYGGDPGPLEPPPSDGDSVSHSVNGSRNSSVSTQGAPRESLPTGKGGGREGEGSTTSRDLGSSVTEGDARATSLLPLRQALEDVKLLVRWDKLDDDAVDRIAWLVDTHGVPALVAAAQRAWQPNDPPGFANAWLGAWNALPLPNAARISLVPAWCGQCQSDDYRWVELDDGRAAHCPRCHPSTVRAVTA